MEGRGEERDDLGALSFPFFLQPCNGFASRSRRRLASSRNPKPASRSRFHHAIPPSIPIIGKMEPRLTIVLLDTSVLIEALPQQISRRRDSPLVLLGQGEMRSFLMLLAMPLKKEVRTKQSVSLAPREAGKMTDDRMDGGRGSPFQICISAKMHF